MSDLDLKERLRAGVIYERKLDWHNIDGASNTMDEAADRIAALEDALRGVIAAMNKARDMVPDEEDGLAADVFAKVLNAAQMEAARVLKGDA